MDGTGRAKFAVDFGVPALQTFLAHINVMFRADVASQPVGMMGTGFQIHTSFFAKAFEFIADLNNQEPLKTSQNQFVNIFIIAQATSLKNRQ